MNPMTFCEAFYIFNTYLNAKESDKSEAEIARDMGYLTCEALRRDVASARLICEKITH